MLCQEHNDKLLSRERVAEKPHCNSLTTQTKPARAGRWKPGQSGNPTGKNGHNKLFDAAALARSHAPEAIKALVIALRYPKERVPAAIALLDRGFGKPLQEQHISTESSLTVLHILAARALSNELKAIDGNVSTDVVEATPVDTAADAAPTRRLHLTMDQPEE